MRSTMFGCGFGGGLGGFGRCKKRRNCLMFGFGWFGVDVSGFWEDACEVKIYEPLYQVLRLVDTEIVPIMPIVYELMRVMKDAVKQQRGSKRVLNIIQDRWDKCSITHYILQKYQYRDNIEENSDLLKVVHNVYAQLDTEVAGIANFGNEDGRKCFGERASIAAISKMQPADWWVMYGNCAPSLRAIAVRLLSQTSQSSACERNWSTFALIRTKQRNRLVYSKLEQLVYYYYNMKLKLRDMAAEKDKVNETDFMDLLQVAVEAGDDNENPIFDWVRPTSLDDDEGNLDPHIASHAQDMRINVEQVIIEEVGVDRGVTVSSSSDDQHTFDGNNGGKDDGDDVDGADETRDWDSGARRLECRCNKLGCSCRRLGCWCNRLEC
ncbi:hypothetical protein Dsin_011726 [Dipteronia sinensis]|uniref:HAT C-terminal dimerisation domain-containing protein n=1 Tax=Dipteronia sinensis TaxID=43782 RepID=A0AAE0AGY3_9ROSI|nr:hypothetical protein Dsin_011726 [Dipteronia sinensis]